MNKCIVDSHIFYISDEFKEFSKKEKEMCANNPNMKEANEKIVKILQRK